MIRIVSKTGEFTFIGEGDTLTLMENFKDINLQCPKPDALNSELFEGDVVYHQKKKNMYMLVHIPNRNWYLEPFFLKYNPSNIRTGRLGLDALAASHKIGDAYHKGDVVAPISVVEPPKVIKMRNYERIGKYTIQEVFDFMDEHRSMKVLTPSENVDTSGETNLILKKKKVTRQLFDGVLIKPSSLRMDTFRFKGCVCVACGIEGTFFAMERNSGKRVNDSYHLNLYALDTDRNEILMTKDHIIPLSRGGADNLSNMQTMCSPCNWEKGNKI